MQYRKFIDDIRKNISQKRMKAVDEGFEFVNGKSFTSTVEKLINSHHPNVIVN